MLYSNPLDFSPRALMFLSTIFTASIIVTDSILEVGSYISFEACYVLLQSTWNQWEGGPWTPDGISYTFQFNK